MGTPFAWTPTDTFAESCNVSRFARSLGMEPTELLRRSVDDIAWFWDAWARAMPIEFFEPYHTVLDDSRGMAWSRWFVGGRLNVAHNCVDRHAMSSRKDKTAITWEGEDGEVRRLTYGELATETNRLANALKRLGVAKGDRVALYLPMIPEVVTALMAVAKIGAVALPIFSGFGASAVSVRLNNADAKVVITADGFQRKGKTIPLKMVADEAVEQSPCVKYVLVVRRTGAKTSWVAPRDIGFDQALAKESNLCECESMDSEDPFLLIYTSGTTGIPKGAVHVHGGFLAKISQEVAHQADLREDDLLYWFTDMGWIMGPWEVVGGLALGASLFLYEGSPDFPVVDRLWSQVSRHKVTVLGVSPTLVRSLMRHGDEPVMRHDLSSIRLLGSTGEPWNEGPWNWYFETVGQGRCPVVNFSGGTEVGACLVSPLPCFPIKPCTVGGPSLGMAVDVVDDHGKPIRGRVGELVCTKPWPGMTRGLWNDPDRFLSSYWPRSPDVWVHGDWASIDQDGQWFLHGRSDDTLNIAGKRLGPAEIESILVSHPGVVEAAAVGLPDDLKGECLWTFVVLKPDVQESDVLRAELKLLVADALGKSFAPETVRFVTDLPKTRSAKVMRRAIRAVILGADPGDLSSLENPSALAGLGPFRSAL